MGSRTTQVEDPVQQTIEKCRSLSPNIEVYFAEEQFLGDVATVDLINPTFLKNRALNMLLNELDQLGVLFDIDTDQLVSIQEYLLLLYALRDKLDKDNLISLLKSGPEELVGDLDGLVQDIQDSSDFLADLSGFFNSRFPTDENWEYIFNRRTIVYSDDRLVAHIRAIIRVASSPLFRNDMVVPEGSLMTTHSWLKYLDEHIQLIQKATEQILFSDDTLIKEKIYAELENHDADLTRQGVLETMSDYYYRLGRKQPTDTPQVRIRHKRNSRHHFEYYRQRNIAPTKEELVLLVTNLMVPGVTKEKLIDRFNHLIANQSPVLFPPDSVELMKKYIDAIDLEADTDAS